MKSKLHFFLGLRPCTFLFLLLLIWDTGHCDPFYHDHKIFWWSPHATMDSTFRLICSKLQGFDQQLRNADCRYASQLSKDSLFHIYSHWLQINLDRQAQATDLSPRDSATKTIISRDGGDELFLCDSSEKVCLHFRQGPHPEIYLLHDHEIIANSLANWIYSHRRGVEFRPDSNELRRLKNAPDTSYRFSPLNRYWFALSWGQEWGLYAQHGNSVGFQQGLLSNAGADSSNLWNWMHGYRPEYNMAIGGEVSGIFGYSLYGGMATLNARIRPEAQNEVKSWNWTEWWVGVLLRLGYTQRWEKYGIENYPHISLAINQTRFSENFTPGDTNFLNSAGRQSFPSLTGTEIAIGDRIRFPWNFSVNWEWGFNHLARPDDQENYSGPSQTLIAASSTSLFQRIWIEYDWN